MSAFKPWPAPVERIKLHKPSPPSINLFRTQINGIPCSCKVTHYSSATPASMHADAEPEEFEFVILDHRNVLAPWLESQITQEIEDRLLEEYHLTRLEFKHYIED